MRHRIRMRLLLLCVLILSSGFRASAQNNPNLDVGLTPYKTYDLGDIDSVSLLNGNLYVHIPLILYPQRGSLKLDVFATYNDKGWRVAHALTRPAASEAFHLSALHNTGNSRVAYPLRVLQRVGPSWVGRYACWLFDGSSVSPSQTYR